MFPLPRPIYPVAAIREIEALALPGAHPPLMERAGAAAARLARGLVAPGGSVLIACGPGNNGGDGLVMARLLQDAGHPVYVALGGDPERLPPDAAQALARWRAAGGEVYPELPTNGHWALVVDALFGIGLQRPITGRYADWIEHLNKLAAPRLALDIPSGLEADSGRCMGVCFAATHTLTFIALKPGLLTLDGPDYCGEIHVADLDLATESQLAASGHELSPAAFAHHLHLRRRNTHKGSYGDVGVIGGAPGMVGAALLAARAAAHLGAGRVLVGLQDSQALAVDVLHPELMFRPAADLVQTPGLGALAVDPGLGQSDAATELLQQALIQPVALVLDADALNLIARHEAFQSTLAHRSSPSLLTPHPAEAARLLGVSTAEIQHDRLAASLALARRYHCPVVLKGSGSLVAAPNGRWWINTTGNPAMATAGMGDVLSGLIAALLAQDWPALTALQAGVHLHAQAGDEYCAEHQLDCGLLASEIPLAARRCYNRWLGQR